MLAWMMPFGFWATAYYEVVLAPLFLAGFILLHENPDQISLRRLGLAGLIIGIGIMIKQHTGLVAIFAIVGLLIPLRKPGEGWPASLGKVIVFCISLVIPAILYAIYYNQMGGSFREWFYWNVTFILTGPYRVGAALLPTSQEMRAILPALILLIPYVMGVKTAPGKASFTRASRFWLLAFLAAAFVFAYPRYSSRHLAVAFPFLVGIAGIVCADIVDLAKEKKDKLFLWSLSSAFVIWWSLLVVLGYLPNLNNSHPQQFSEYSRLIPLAEVLKPRLPSNGGLVILPVDEGNANLYYLLQELPPHYHFDFQPWFTFGKTSRMWLRAVEEEKPQSLVYFQDRLDLALFSPEIIEYIDQHYQLIDSLTWEGSEVQILNRKDGE
jgi:hypothetical protein